MEAMKTELIVLGNGPSLSGVDFHTMLNRPTLGMNAAYRYWRRIDWRPTYYCCLDDALIDTHKSAILEMVAENRIEKFFLTGRILKYFPELAEDKRVYFLDEFVPHWHRVRGSKYGLELFDRPEFRTCAPEMLTTGAYSVRFGAMLGYSTIHLLGVDLRYVPLQEARALRGTRLEIQTTPEVNPNYFFDDYQTAGDHFNIANPDKHERELHVSSFITLRDDFVQNAINVSISNGSENSKLFQQAILPFRSNRRGSKYVLKRRLETVCLELTEFDITLLQKILDLWSEPAFFPLMGRPGDTAFDLEIVVPTADYWDIAREFKINTRLRSCFRSVRTTYRSSVTKQMDQEKWFLNEYTLPVSCDWLNDLAECGTHDNAFLAFDSLPETPSDLSVNRVEQAGSVILKSRSIKQRVQTFDRANHEVSLNGVLFGFAASRTSEPVSREKRASWAKRLIGGFLK